MQIAPHDSKLHRPLRTTTFQNGDKPQYSAKATELFGMTLMNYFRRWSQLHSKSNPANWCASTMLLYCNPAKRAARFRGATLCFIVRKTHRYVTPSGIREKYVYKIIFYNYSKLLTNTHRRKSWGWHQAAQFLPLHNKLQSHRAAVLHYIVNVGRQNKRQRITSIGQDCFKCINGN